MKSGKKLTRQQMKLLNERGISNAQDYLYLKTITVSEDGKAAARNGSKQTIMIVINKITDQTVEIEI